MGSVRAFFRESLKQKLRLKSIEQRRIYSATLVFRKALLTDEHGRHSLSQDWPLVPRRKSEQPPLNKRIIRAISEVADQHCPLSIKFIIQHKIT